jgi:hypothetical protein
LAQFLEQFDGECGATLRDVEPDQLLEGVEASLGVFGTGRVDQQFGELLGFSDDGGASGECGLRLMEYMYQQLLAREVEFSALLNAIDVPLRGELLAELHLLLFFQFLLLQLLGMR